MDSNYTCLAVTILNSAFKEDKFLKECKYTEKIVTGHINNNLSYFFSSDESNAEQVWMN